MRASQTVGKSKPKIYLLSRLYMENKDTVNTNSGINDNTSFQDSNFTVLKFRLKNKLIHILPMWCNCFLTIHKYN